MGIAFVLVRKFFLTEDVIDILCLVYSTFRENKKNIQSL